MDTFTRTDLDQLVETRDGTHVSITMPTHRTGPELRQDPIRFKNLLNDAEERLVSLGFRTPEVRRFLAQAAELERNGDFWQHQAEGLAVFIAPDFFRTFRLPQVMDEQVTIADRFAIAPLMPMLEAHHRFYILGVSLHKVRFFEATRHSIREVSVGGLPRNLPEALGFDEEKTYEFHQAGAEPGGEAGIFRGQDQTEVSGDILEYLNAIDRAIGSTLAGRREPLVFAGVQYLFPIYRQTNSYRPLATQSITGSIERMRPEELHQQALPLVEPLFRKARNEAAIHFEDRLGAHGAGTDLEEILEAAVDGRVEALFVAHGAHRPGTFDEASRQVQFHDAASDSGEDLVERAIYDTIRCGGEVFAVEADEVPGGKTFAAVYRYAVTQPHV